jgi:hypothetical protein
MQKALVVLLITCLGAVGCAGRTPNPVQSYQPGDDQRSCSGLKAELANLEGDIQRKLPDSDKTGTNVALGVAGAFLIVPWFFMDFSKADQVEMEALRRRYNNLVILSAEKKCGFENKEIPAFEKPKEPAKET